LCLLHNYFRIHVELISELVVKDYVNIPCHDGLVRTQVTDEGGGLQLLAEDADKSRKQLRTAGKTRSTDLRSEHRINNFYAYSRISRH
jgi:hypothetical protein